MVNKVSWSYFSFSTMIVLLDYILLLSQQNLLKMSAIKFRSNVWKRTWQGARTNKWYTQWQRCFYNNRCGLIPISGQMAVAHTEVTFCVWLISPRWIASRKFPWYVKKKQRRNFKPFKLRHRVSNSLRKEQMWQESWADPRKVPERKGREL